MRRSEIISLLMLGVGVVVLSVLNLAVCFEKSLFIKDVRIRVSMGRRGAGEPCWKRLSGRWAPEITEMDPAPPTEGH